MSSPSHPFAVQPDDDGTDVKTCPKCHADMPGQMRFCRLCGYRLGEGVSEYAETARFQQPPSAAAARNVGRHCAKASAAQAYTPPGNAAEWGAMAQHTSGQVIPRAGALLGPRKRGRKFTRWFIWAIIASMISSAAISGVIKSSRGFRGGPDITINVPSLPELPEVAEGSYLGADGFEDTGDGVFLDYVTPPGSAADKAGLVGGDIITSFDGQPVKKVDQFMNLLSHTPAGKTVEVVYIRDHETRKAKLTTISEDENAKLDDLADNNSKGFIGEGTDLDRVLLPGLNIYGVRLNQMRPNNPAAISGLRNGDIIIEFGSVPTRTRRELESRIRQAQPGSTVKAIVMRGSERVEVPIKIGESEDE